MDVAGDFGSLGMAEKKRIALRWQDILAWEIERVSPKTLFTVGKKPTKLVEFLQQRKLIPSIPTHGVTHYAHRRSHDEVRTSIIEGISIGLGPLNRAQRGSVG